MYPIQSTLPQVHDALKAHPTELADAPQVALIAALPPIVRPSVGEPVVGESVVAYAAPIILPCVAFSSTVIDPTPTSFKVEINCPTNAIARCIAWMEYPEDGSVVNADDLMIKANFWSYAKNANVAQDGVSAIIVKDAVSEGFCQRVISFPNLPKNPRPTWDVRCSYTGDTGVCILIFNDIFTD